MYLKFNFKKKDTKISTKLHSSSARLSSLLPHCLTANPKLDAWAHRQADTQTQWFQHTLPSPGTFIMGDITKKHRTQIVYNSHLHQVCPGAHQSILPAEDKTFKAVSSSACTHFTFNAPFPLRPRVWLVWMTFKLHHISEETEFNVPQSC